MLYLHCILMCTSSSLDIINHDLDVFVIEDFANSNNIP